MTTRARPKTNTKDLGVAAVERSFTEMAVDEQWSVRGERGFTWWGAWVRQHVWAGEAVRSRGETLWHVRARTAAYRDQPDEPGTYAFTCGLNALPGLSAYAYDPDDRTISARCGVFTYDGVHEWLERFFRVSVALQASIAWLQAPAEADGRPLDDQPHPDSGPRKDPDDMLNFAGSFPGTPSPFTPPVLRAAAAVLAGEGAPADFDEEASLLRVLVPVSAEAAVLWGLTSQDHPLLGQGADVRLVVPVHEGPVRTAWLANALNLAEAADWSGEDRPHALGAWTAGDGFLVHVAFFPAVVFGDGSDDGALIAIRNLLAWAGVRATLRQRSACPGWRPRPGPGTRTTSRRTDRRKKRVAGGPRNRTGRRSPVCRTRGSRSRSGHSGRPPGRRGRARRLRSGVHHASCWSIRRTRPRSRRSTMPLPRPRMATGSSCGRERTGGRWSWTARSGSRATVRSNEIRLEPAGGEALGIAASGSTIEGLTIRPAEAGNDGSLWSAVAVHDATVTIEGCDLTTHLGATVWVGGPGSRAVLLGCSLTGGSQNAVWVAEEGRAELAACVVSGNRWPMSAVGEHASLAITDSEVIDNLDGGAHAAGGATLVIEGSTVARNGGFGVLLEGAAPASRVEDCTIEANAAAGVGIAGSRGVRVLRNRIRRNDVGIVVIGGAAPTVEANELAGNRLGMGVRGEDSDPVVVSNAITGGADQGLIVDEKALGRYEGNRVSGSGGVGVWVDNEGTRPSFSGNNVSACGSVGILVTNGAGGDFRSNDLRGNADGSWGLHGQGDLTRAGNLEDAGTTSGEPEPRLMN